MSSRTPPMISAPPMMMLTNLDMPGANRHASGNNLEALPRRCEELTAQPDDSERAVARALYENHVAALSVGRRGFRHAVLGGYAFRDRLDRGPASVFRDGAIGFIA